MMRRTAAVLVAALLLAACGDGTTGMDPGGDPPSGDELAVHVASYDVAAGMERRFIVGLDTADNLFVSGGRVTMRFSYRGDGGQEPEPYREAQGSFLPLPGDEPSEELPSPVVGPASVGRGVYATEISFDRAGFWEVEVTAEVEGGETLRGTGAFEVLTEPLIPAPGDRAPRTENLTIDTYEDDGAPPGAVDSRAEATGEIPNPELHDTTIAESIRAGRPALVIFSTPVYCVSRFCGPITEMVAELAEEHGDRAEFIHVEVWRDFQGQTINRAAAEWLLRENDLQEPWVFLIGADGRIVERWDNVATRPEIEPYLTELPAD